MLLRRVLWTSVVVIVGVYLASDADLTLRYRADVVGLPNDAFRGRTIFLIGASSGIGAALAEEFALRGARLALAARRRDKLEALAARCLELGAVQAFAVPLDALDFAAHDAALAAAREGFGGEVPHTLVLNAGRSQRDTALETPLSTTRELLELNLLAPIALATAWARARQSDGGHVVVTSSVSGKLGTPVASSYSASKFGLHGYFDALRVELAGRDLDVTLACPGPVVSEIAIHAHGRTPSAGTVDVDASKMPTHRCAYLIAVATYCRAAEVWIATQPFLLFTALYQYAPRLALLLGRRVGAKRVAAFQEGRDMFQATAGLGAILGAGSSSSSNKKKTPPGSSSSSFSPTGS